MVGIGHVIDEEVGAAVVAVAADPHRADQLVDVHRVDEACSLAAEGVIVRERGGELDELALERRRHQPLPDHRLASTDRAEVRR